MIVQISFSITIIKSNIFREEQQGQGGKVDGFKLIHYKFKVLKNKYFKPIEIYLIPSSFFHIILK